MAATPHIEFPPPPERICKGPCRRKLPIAAFVHSKRSPDGYLHVCKACHRARCQRYDLPFDPRDITAMIDRATGKAS